MNLARYWFIVLGFSVVSAFAMSDSDAGCSSKYSITREDYYRAERFLPWNADKYVLNGKIAHHWIGKTDRFWYKRQTINGGKQFILVDPEEGQKRAAFNHAKIASLLASVTGNQINPHSLPFDRFSYFDNETAIEAMINGAKWHCSLAREECKKAPPGPGPGDLVSPDGKWAAFLKGQNIWLRSLETGEERALTSNGEERYAYGALVGLSVMDIMRQRNGMPVSPIALWSPDSTKLLTERVDLRWVPDTYLLQHAPEDGSVRPVFYRLPYSLPVDEYRANADIYIFDIARGTTTKMQHDQLPAVGWGPVGRGAWWSQNSKSIFVAPEEEGLKRQKLLKIEADTGKTTVLVQETSDTFVDGVNGRNSIRTLKSGEIIWSSERDGWNHLYLYDSEGEYVRKLTSGEWAVRSIVHIDEMNREVYFTANGRETGEDIYFRHLYVVNMDTGELRILTPENADHNIVIPDNSPIFKYFGQPGPEQAGFSPSGRYFIESYSRVDLPPATILRDDDGNQIMTIEEADISALEKSGINYAEPFEVLATDGVTPIYGNIYRPTDFDPSCSYPVIDAIYPGPQSIRSQKNFIGAMFDDPHALAELGFIVVTLDGRGTPHRSKAFLDDVYGNFEKSGNLEDHIAGIKQLSERYPYIDINKVGIYGHSGGGYASARAILAYPNFYKVAVSASGNHDQRGFSIWWGPRYAGLYDKKTNNYQEHVNANLADNLEGKLFLVHGELDDGVPPALTMQLADALINANKEFDFLILPNTGHIYGEGIYATYFYRRKWDYFVRNLLGAEPPKNYRITSSGDKQ